VVKREKRNCKACGTILNIRNITGYCRICYRDSPERAEKQSVSKFCKVMESKKKLEDLEKERIIQIEQESVENGE